MRENVSHDISILTKIRSKLSEGIIMLFSFFLKRPILHLRRIDPCPFEENEDIVTFAGATGF
jgi:hypothetical protein